MKTFVIMFCILFYFVNCAFAQTTVVTQNPYINNPYYRHQNYYQTDVLPRDLSALEKYSMNKVYPRQSALQRLERLENLAFGSIQSGSLEARYRNVENAILSRPKCNFKHSALGALANYFGGHTTGVTPSVFDNFGNAYMPAYDNFMHNSSAGYGRSRINSFSNGIFGSGYSIMNNNLGNGSSVRILD